MKPFVPYLLLLSLIVGCRPGQPQVSDFYMPAEYAPQDAVWLGWEDYPPYHQPFFDIARALYSQVPIKVVTDSEASVNRLRDTLLTLGMDPERFRFHVIPDNRYWMRDHGATYVIDGRGGKKVVDFGWTLYGNREWLQTYYAADTSQVEAQYRRALGATGAVDSIMGAVDGLESIRTDVNMEGGSIEVNGRGTLIQTESVTFQRNPGKSREYLESELKRVLGVEQVIWLKQGLAEDGFWWNRIHDNYYGWGVNGHTDEFVRFVNDSTLLLAWVDEAEKDLSPIHQENYRRMSENREILEKARRPDGRAFRVIPFPLPDLMVHTTTVADRAQNDSPNFRDWQVSSSWGPRPGELKPGDSIHWVAASSYLNYLVTNERILMSTYVGQGSSPEKEERAKRILSEAFPGRELVLLDMMNINFNGGGIHCSTQQEPSALAAQ